MRALPPTILIAGLIAASSAGPGSTQPITHPTLFHTVPGAEGVTYADLVRLLVPDLAIDGDHHRGSQLAAIRHISGDLDEGEPPRSFALDRVVAMPVNSGGRDRLALLVDLGTSEATGEDFVVLALYETADGPALLDAANIAFDRFTYLFDPPRLAVGAGDDLLLTFNTHHNSNQSYAATSLVLAREGRLELVDTIFTLDDRTCVFERIQRLDISMGEGSPFAPILALVTEETTPTNAQCGDAVVPGPPSRSVAVTYRWDEAQARYVADSDGFDALARENETRF